MMFLCKRNGEMSSAFNAYMYTREGRLALKHCFVSDQARNVEIFNLIHNG